MNIKNMENTFKSNANTHLKKDLQYQSDTTKTTDTRRGAAGGLLIQATVSSQTLHSVLLEGISGSEDSCVYSADKEDCRPCLIFLGN